MAFRALAVAAVILLAVGCEAQAALVFSLDAPGTSGASCSVATPCGTVTVQQAFLSGNSGPLDPTTVDITIVLSGVDFNKAQNPAQFHALAFDLNPIRTVTFANFVDNGGAIFNCSTKGTPGTGTTIHPTNCVETGTDTFSAVPFSNSNTYHYAIDNTTSNVTTTQLMFTATVPTGLSPANFEAGTGNNTFFVVDINLNGSTGNIGATHFIKTPEPATIALFAIGLAGLGMVRRKRRAQVQG